MPRPRLPMMLGLALLTTMAHFLVAVTHLTLHVVHRVDDFALPVLLGGAPFVGVALMMRGRPRHGAALLALTMLAGAFHTLYSHYWLLDDAPDTRFYAGVVQMLLAMQLQGLCAGLILIVKPEEPRAAAGGLSSAAPRDGG